MCAFAADWSNSIPADHTKLNTGPASVVAVRVAVSDRLATIVNGFTSGETSPIGILKLPFIAVSAPSTVTDQYQLYGKVVGGKTLLHGKDEDGTEVVFQGMRSGDILLSSSTTTPPSFTDVSTTYANKFIRISATALSTGGADTHDHGAATGSYTLGIADIPAHTHTVGLNNGVPGGVRTPENVGSTGTSDTIATGSTGGGGGHSHTVASANNVPAYVTLKAYQKD